VGVSRYDVARYGVHTATRANDGLTGGRVIAGVE